MQLARVARRAIRKDEEAFAVRPGLNGHLDLARKLYSTSIEDIHLLVDRYRAECTDVGMHAR